MALSTELASQQTAEAFIRLLAIMAELREKCPWDQKQTMESLRHLTLEEAFELSEAVLEGDMQEIKKELGDLLLHIVFYAHIASETQTFTITEVIQTLCEKLIYRHPHIYGQQTAEDSKAVEQNWEKLKLKEGKNKSILGGVPPSLPSLIKAVRVQEKARRAGFEGQTQATRWAKIQQAMQTIAPQMEQPLDATDLQDAWGHLLFTLADYAKVEDINPEEALEKANKTFVQKIKAIEQKITQQGQELADLSPQVLQRYWEETTRNPD